MANEPAVMSRTPWGPAEKLRERALPPGPGTPREVGEKNQLDRVFGAMVACVANQGYEATTVRDLLELSGVSRSSFYSHFRDKEDCFLATLAALEKMGADVFYGGLDGEGTSREKAHRAVGRTLQAVAANPAAANLYNQTAYALGPRGRDALEKSMADFAPVLARAMAGITGREELPPKMIRAILGGAQFLVQVHLRRGEHERIPGLADPLIEWALGYEAPPTPLRLAGRQPKTVDSYPPAYVAYSPAERIIRALAATAGERGYPSVTIAEIAARAQMSQATFYAHFEDKEAALVAALDSSAMQTLAAVVPAARRAPDWPNGLRAGIGALCYFAAAEPDFARLATVETYAAGPKALEQRDTSIEMIRVLMHPGFKLAGKDFDPIVADAVLGAMWGLFYSQIVNEGPESMPEIAPLATYIGLSPFIGAEKAAAVANGDGRGSRSRPTTAPDSPT